MLCGGIELRCLIFYADVSLSVLCHIIRDVLTDLQCSACTEKYKTSVGYFPIQPSLSVSSALAMVQKVPHHFILFIEIPYLDYYTSKTSKNDCFIDHEVGKLLPTSHVSTILTYTSPPYVFTIKSCLQSVGI